MTVAEFWRELQKRIQRYNLLIHPFYEAWVGGTLSRAQIHNYATECQFHVAAYCSYLEQFESRLTDGELLERMRSFRTLTRAENGKRCLALWSRFVESTGTSTRNTNILRGPTNEIAGLIHRCFSMARYRSPGEFLASFWAHEAGLVSLFREQSIALVRYYGLSDYDTAYFSDRHESAVRNLEFACAELNGILIKQPFLAHSCLRAGEEIAFHLWATLDGLDRRIRSPEVH